MDRERMAAMADRIAKEESDEPLIVVDQAIDNIIASIMAINENLPKVKADTPSQKKALETVKDLMETAIEPYMMDIAKAMNIFEAMV